MEKEVEERINLLEKLGGVIKEERKAYGIIDAVWGMAVLIGFSIFQIVEIASFPWYYGFIPLVASLAIAFILTPFFVRKLKGFFGYRKGWLGEKIRMAWIMVAFIGGTSYMLVFWSHNLRDFINAISPGEISGIILTGWLIIDGIGCMVQGVISETKAHIGVGISMAISAIVVANTSFIYAWAAFALTFGLGYVMVGLKNYADFNKIRMKEGVESWI